MPTSVAIYLPEPWTANSAADWMRTALGWQRRDPKDVYNLDFRGGRAAAVAEPGDADTATIGIRLGGFAPTTYVLIEPGYNTYGSMPHIVATVLAFARESTQLLFLFQHERVLLRASGGALYIPKKSLEWWETEGAFGMVKNATLE